jgi:hypothetical protein
MVDLTVPSVSLKVLPDRRVEVSLSVANRGAYVGRPAWVFVQSTWGTHKARLAPVEPGSARDWSWVSPVLDTGDHPVTVTVEPERDVLDANESNNVVRRIVSIPRDQDMPRGRGVVRMPSVVGLSRRDASRTLVHAGLRAPRWYENAQGPSVNRIERQWPEAGWDVPRGTKPVLVTSARAVVPSVTGLPLDQVRDDLREAGLEVGPLEVQPSKEHGVRRVLAQDPAPGSTARVGSGVRLTVVEPMPGWPLALGSLLFLLSLILTIIPMVSAPAFGTRRSMLPEFAMGSIMDTDLDTRSVEAPSRFGRTVWEETENDDASSESVSTTTGVTDAEPERDESTETVSQFLTSLAASDLWVAPPAPAAPKRTEAQEIEWPSFESVQEAAAPATAEPATREHDRETPVVEEHAIEEPVFEEPVLEEPAFDRAVVEEPAIHEPAFESPSLEAETAASEATIPPAEDVVTAPAPSAAPAPSHRGWHRDLAGLVSLATMALLAVRPKKRASQETPTPSPDAAPTDAASPDAAPTDAASPEVASEPTEAAGAFAWGSRTEAVEDDLEPQFESIEFEPAAMHEASEPFTRERELHDEPAFASTSIDEPEIASTSVETGEPVIAPRHSGWIVGLASMALRVIRPKRRTATVASPEPADVEPRSGPDLTLRTEAREQVAGMPFRIFGSDVAAGRNDAAELDRLAPDTNEERAEDADAPAEPTTLTFVEPVTVLETAPEILPEASFQHTWDHGNQRVTWHLDTAPPTLMFVLVHDPGEQVLACSDDMRSSA